MTDSVSTNSKSSQIQYDSVDTVLSAIKAGKIVIVVDAADRENEGDFICAAETITPDIVDFMARQGAGKLCVPLTQDVASRLNLKPIVDDQQNTSLHQTKFLIDVDHRDSGTGISAESRAKTIRALTDPTSRATDFVRPGHISPLLAKEGGVLRRAGHTEATIDLMRMAGKTPVGVLIEICSQRGGEMADAAELQEIAAKFDIPITSIAELIQHRRIRDQLVTREVEVTIPTGKYGTAKFIAYRVDYEEQEPMAIVWGDLAAAEKPPLIRMHSSCFTGDVLDSLRCDCGDQLHISMQMISKEGAGAVVYLPQEGRGIGLVAKLKAYRLQEQGFDTVEANHKLGFKADMRDYMVGLQILKDLGLREIRLLTNNAKKTKAFEDWVDLKVVEQVPLIAPPEKHREQYMATKRDKMGHLLPKPPAPTS